MGVVVVAILLGSVEIMMAAVVDSVEVVLFPVVVIGSAEVVAICGFYCGRFCSSDDGCCGGGFCGSDIGFCGSRDACCYGGRFI